jgi:hypothetical protein
VNNTVHYFLLRLLLPFCHRRHKSSNHLPIILRLELRVFTFRLRNLSDYWLIRYLFSIYKSTSVSYKGGYQHGCYASRHFHAPLTAPFSKVYSFSLSYTFLWSCASTVYSIVLRYYDRRGLSTSVHVVIITPPASPTISSY